LNATNRNGPARIERRRLGAQADRQVGPHALIHFSASGAARTAVASNKRQTGVEYSTPVVWARA